MSTKTKLKGPYHPSFEKDCSGFGLIADIDDKTGHWLIKTSIAALPRLTHRGAIAADGTSGNGCGLLFNKPVSLLRRNAVAFGSLLETPQSNAA